MNALVIDDEPQLREFVKVVLQEDGWRSPWRSLLSRRSTCCGSFIEVMKQVGRVAATSLPVLLTGESGI
jgi:hypothetical protein